MTTFKWKHFILTIIISNLTATFSVTGRVHPITFYYVLTIIELLIVKCFLISINWENEFFLLQLTGSIYLTSRGHHLFHNNRYVGFNFFLTQCTDCVSWWISLNKYLNQWNRLFLFFLFFVIWYFSLHHTAELHFAWGEIVNAELVSSRHIIKWFNISSHFEFLGSIRFSGLVKHIRVHFLNIN